MTEDVYSSSDSNFSIGSMKRMIKSVSNKSVGKDAANELGMISEEKAEEVANEAIEVAEENGRKTVRKEDIRQALR